MHCRIPIFIKLLTKYCIQNLTCRVEEGNIVSQTSVQSKLANYIDLCISCTIIHVKTPERIYAVTSGDNGILSDHLKVNWYPDGTNYNNINSRENQ